jgi:hypothetical protein
VLCSIWSSVNFSSNNATRSIVYGTKYQMLTGERFPLYRSTFQGARHRLTTNLWPHLMQHIAPAQAVIQTPSAMPP